MKTTFFLRSIPLISLLPIPAMAQVLNTAYFDSMMEMFWDFLNLFPTLLIGLAIAAFFWGLVRYIYGLSNGDSDAVDNARRLMIWGVIGIAVMVSIYGIIEAIQAIFGIENYREPLFPEIPTIG